jgi:hypothetical protein
MPYHTHTALPVRTPLGMECSFFPPVSRLLYFMALLEFFLHYSVGCLKILGHNSKLIFLTSLNNIYND